MYPNLKVLLVEDNASNRLIGAKILKVKCGIEPDTAENGRMALDRMREKVYDLVFMDCMMPEMDGYEATRRIRAGEAGEESKEVVIIAMTANTSEESQEECLNVGMTDHMGKPVSPVKLVELVDRWARA